MLEVKGSAEQRPAEELGPVELEILWGALQSITNEMALAIQRSGYSVVITEGRDFSGALFSRDGFLVAGAETDLPLHVGTGQPCVQSVIAEIGLADMREGDIYAMNDPFRGNTHFNDVRMMMPLFDGGEVRAFAVTSAHWTDIGGIVPGSFNVMSRECYQEGVRIPPVRVVSEGEVNLDLMRLVLANVRNPAEAEGDFYGQIAACRAGAVRFGELAQKYGVATVERAMDQIQAHSESLLRQELAKLPDCEYSWEDWIDEDPTTGKPVGVRLTCRIEGDRIVYDFSASDPAVDCSMNSHRGTTTAAALVTTKMIFPGIPINGGMLRPIEVVTKPDTIADAREPRAVGAAGGTSWMKLHNCIVGVWSMIAPQLVPAESYNILDLHIGGLRADTGDPTVCYLWADGGHGARWDQDGGSSIFCDLGASIQNIPVELQERRAPVRIERYAHREGSAGAGRYRGGAGTRRVVRILDELSGGRLAFFGDRGKIPGRGLHGGSGGAGSGVRLIHPDGRVDDLGVIGANVRLEPGDAVEVVSQGGGGFGPPLERDPQAVLDDVRDELVTIEQALDQYGVVVHEIDRLAALYELDVVATERERARRVEDAARQQVGS